MTTAETTAETKQEKEEEEEEEEERVELKPENVKSRPRLESSEKGTGINWEKDQDMARISSSEASIMRRLLSHPHFRPNRSRCEVYQGSVTTVYGRLPIGCLKIGPNSRQSAGHHRVVSDSVLSDPDDED